MPSLREGSPPDSGWDFPHFDILPKNQLGRTRFACRQNWTTTNPRESYRRCRFRRHIERPYIAWCNPLRRNNSDRIRRSQHTAKGHKPELQTQRNVGKGFCRLRPKIVVKKLKLTAFCAFLWLSSRDCQRAAAPEFRVFSISTLFFLRVIPVEWSRSTSDFV